MTLQVIAMYFKVTSNIARRSNAFLPILLLATVFITSAVAQVQPNLPVRAPGYEQYYHDDQQPMAFATRWGYYEGWQDGRHDRDVGRPPVPTDQDHYKLAPDHGLHPGLNRDAYKTAYRSAYVKGYLRGVKR